MKEVVDTKEGRRLQETWWVLRASPTKGNECLVLELLRDQALSDSSRAIGSG